MRHFEKSLTRNTAITDFTFDHVDINDENHKQLQLKLVERLMGCETEYVLLWNASYIPCHDIQMFDDRGIPILDFCDELVINDGIQNGLIQGLKKIILKSFRAGHILFKMDIFREMIEEIENSRNEKVTYQKRIPSIIDTIQEELGRFDLFEMYGSYVLWKYPKEYVYREWHTFRQGADLLEPEEVTDDLLTWLGKDYDAVSFEPGHHVREDNRGLLSNTDYQKKLTPRQMVQAIQGEYKEESFADKFFGERIFTADEIKNIAGYAIEDEEWKLFERIGDERKDYNIDQAWLSWQHAAFLCDDENERKRLRLKMEEAGIMVPPVGIVIVSYNSFQMMRECIESIRRHCGEDEYDLIIVDNASTDGVTEYLKSQEDIRLLLNNDNKGFPVACNQGISISPQEDDIFFLNNDTRMTHNALYWLRMGLYESSDTGAAGCVSNYAGIGQMIDLLLATGENYEAYGKIKNKPIPEPYDDAKILCGFAMLVKRECIDRLGGMDEEFSPGYYEDTDLSLRLRKNGYKLRICKNSYIYHAGGLNFKKRPDLEEINDRNLLYLAEKWGTDFMNA